MNQITKFEVVGIFLSIGVMAVALAMIRFNSDVFSLGPSETVETQSALVVGSGDNEQTATLEGALNDSITTNGKLTRLIIDDVRVGTGPVVKTGDTIVAHYIGTTQNGVKLDSSYDRGEPFSFTVGENMVIKGWDDGLIGMKVGGQRVLVIPPDLAYGDTQVGPIPPNATLVFSIELLEIK